MDTFHSKTAVQDNETLISYRDPKLFQRAAREAMGESYDPTVKVFYETDYTRGHARHVMHALAEK